MLDKAISLLYFSAAKTLAGEGLAYAFEQYTNALLQGGVFLGGGMFREAKKGREDWRREKDNLEKT